MRCFPLSANIVIQLFMCSVVYPMVPKLAPSMQGLIYVRRPLAGQFRALGGKPKVMGRRLSLS